MADAQKSVNSSDVYGSCYKTFGRDLYRRMIGGATTLGRTTFDTMTFAEQSLHLNCSNTAVNKPQLSIDLNVVLPSVFVVIVVESPYQT
jgi:hypothetical protein